MLRKRKPWLSLILCYDIFYWYLSSVPVCELEYDVFISYSSEDEEWVKDELLKNLEADGYKVYIDFKDFVPGKENRQELIKRLH